MKHTIFAACLGIAFAGVASAQSFNIFDGFVVLNVSGGGNTFYDTDLPTENPDFTGTVAVIEQGTSILLGGEVETTDSTYSGQPLAPNSAAIKWAIGTNGFSSLSLPLALPGTPDKWQEIDPGNMAEIGSSLAIGIHTVRVQFSATAPLLFPASGFHTETLPESGSFTALIEVIAGPMPASNACDTASEPGYDAGWTNGSSGASGLGPWTQLIDTVGDGDAAGFFVAVNDPGLTDNDDMENIGSGTPPEGWGLYANEGVTGGDDVQIAGAFRSFTGPLSVGQVFKIQIEHGGVQSGSLSADFPPRTGGWVGFTLRSQAAAIFGDPDPISAFGGIQNALFGFGFRGGNVNYTAYDVASSSGYDTGIPFTTEGVEVTFRLTSASTYDLTIRQLKQGGLETTITGRPLGGGSIQHVGIFNRNAEENDVFFNYMKIEDYLGPITNKLAYDDAADPVYANLTWADGSDGGFGFEPWSLTAIEDGGAAGHFTATNNGSGGSLNFIRTDDKAWGTYASDVFSGGVQFATADRSFSQGELEEGQTFSVQLEHGGISPLNGNVQMILIGTPTFVNEMGHVLTFEFVGGGTNYLLSDDMPGTQNTGIPFTFDGLQLDFTLTRDTAPYTYDLRVELFGGNASIYHFSGEVDTIPKHVQLRIRDVEEEDVWFNRLCILPSENDRDADGMPVDYETANNLNPNANDANDDKDGDGDLNIWEYIADTLADDSNSFFKVNAIGINSPVTLTLDTSTNRIYTLQSTAELVAPSWSNVPGLVDIPGSGPGSSFVDTNETVDVKHYRIEVELP